MIMIIFALGNIPDILLPRYLRSHFSITIRERCGLGFELSGLGLGLSFYDKISVSKFEPGLGLVLDVTVSTTSLIRMQNTVL